jgi:hypothetical protein
MRPHHPQSGQCRRKRKRTGAAPAEGNFKLRHYRMFQPLAARTMFLPASMAQPTLLQ